MLTISMLIKSRNEYFEKLASMQHFYIKYELGKSKFNPSEEGSFTEYWKHWKICGWM